MALSLRSLYASNRDIKEIRVVVDYNAQTANVAVIRDSNEYRFKNGIPFNGDIMQLLNYEVGDYLTWDID